MTERVPRRILGSQPSTGRTTPVSTPSVILEPLSMALEGVDPLTAFAIEEMDPLSKLAAEEVVTVSKINFFVVIICDFRVEIWLIQVRIRKSQIINLKLSRGERKRLRFCLNTRLLKRLQ